LSGPCSRTANPQTENYTLYLTTEEMDFVPETFPDEVVQIMVEIMLPGEIKDKE